MNINNELFTQSYSLHPNEKKIPQLPNELIDTILGFLPLKEDKTILSGLCLVDRRFNRIIKNSRKPNILEAFNKAVLNIIKSNHENSEKLKNIKLFENIPFFNSALSFGCLNAFKTKKICSKGIIKIIFDEWDIDISKWNPKEKNLVFEKVSKLGYLKPFQLLIEKGGVDPSINNNTAINLASKYGHLELVKVLLADSRVNPDESFAIHHASENGCADILNILLKDPRVDPSSRNNLAFKMALIDGHADIISILLKDPRVDPTYNNNFPIVIASARGQIGIVDILLKDRRVDPSTGDNFAIRIASVHGRTEIVDILLKDRRVDPSTSDNSAIQIASENGHTEVVKLLLKDSRVDPSAENNFAIRAALKKGFIDVVKLLLLDDRIDSCYAKEIAQKNEFTEILKILNQRTYSKKRKYFPEEEEIDPKRNKKE